MPPMPRTATPRRSRFGRVRRLLPMVESLEERSSPTSVLHLAGAAGSAAGAPDHPETAARPASYLDAAVGCISVVEG
jgi:hypothetical protein